MNTTKSLIFLNKKANGIALFILDCPSKVNYLTKQVFDEFAIMLKEVIADPNVKALVLLSGKADSFILGADIREILESKSREHAGTLSANGQEILNTLSRTNKPTVVGIHGPCLGGGLELALCTNFRIATDSDTTILGLPETRLGLLPGLGGTQRLPRLIGTKAALDMILNANPISAQEALELGMVDKLVSPDDLVATCEEIALYLVSNEKNGDLPVKDINENAMLEEYESNKKLFSVLERSIQIKTKGHYPAQVKAIEAVKTGLLNGLEAGLKFEAETFGELASSTTAANLINLHINSEFCKAKAKAASDEQPVKFKNLAIIGGGTMGLGLAHLAALNGLNVFISSSSPESSASAVEKANALLSKDSKYQFQEQVKVITDQSPWKEIDIVFETISEDKILKSAVLSKLSKQVSNDCLILTNTSSLSVSELAQSVQNPDRFLGFHLFNPVDKMPLVEIIEHSGSQKEFANKSFAFANQLNKLPILAKDSPGFLVNRIITSYIIAAARLLEENTPLTWIDEAALEFGMPMGPITLMDEVGLNVAIAITEELRANLGERFVPPDIFDRFKKLGLSGKKDLKGIYLWDKSGRKLGTNDELTSKLNIRTTSEKVSAEDCLRIQKRLFYTMANEAAYCLEDKVVRRARDIDLALVMGIGFPAFRGGILRYADSESLAVIYEQLKQMQANNQIKQMPCQQIAKLVAENRTFY